MYNLSSDVDGLRAALAAGSVSAQQRDFAASLCSQYSRKGTLSPKQADWVKRIAYPAAKPAAIQLADSVAMTGIVALFETAAANLKFPAIVFGTDAARAVRAYRAGVKSTEPGSIVVQDHETREYLGRIKLDGRYAPSPKFPDQSGIIEALALFANDPAGAASEYGKRTGCCCFCNKLLQDARSTTVGYGPTCAENYGLAWG